MLFQIKEVKNLFQLVNNNYSIFNINRVFNYIYKNKINNNNYNNNNNKNYNKV